MRSSFPVNPRRVRRSSVPRQPLQCERAAVAPSGPSKASRPTSASTVPQLPTRDVDAEAVALCARVGLTVEGDTNTAEGGAKRCSLSFPQEEPGTSAGVSEGGPSSAAVFSREPSASTTRALSGSLSLAPHAAFPSEAAHEGDGADAQRLFTPSKVVGALVVRVRCLLRQVELPFIDTYVIESCLLQPASFASTSQLPAQEGLAMQTGRRPASSPLPVAAAAALSSPPPSAPSTRPTLADLHVNRTQPQKHSPNNILTHKSGGNSAATSAIELTATAAAASRMSGTESPLLSVKLLRGSKHACYYLAEDSAVNSLPIASKTSGDAFLKEWGKDEAAKKEEPTGQEEPSEKGTPAFLTEGLTTDLKTDANIIDTVAELGSSAHEVHAQRASQTPLLSAPLQRPGAPPRVPPQHGSNDDVGHSPAAAAPHPRSGVSHLSSLSAVPSSSSSSPSSRSELLLLLTKTEDALERYKAALAVALLAVQHREAVWTALQHFLYVVQQDWAPSTRTAETGVVGSEAGDDVSARETNEAEEAPLASASRLVSRSPSLSSSSAGCGEAEEDSTPSGAPVRVTPPPLPLQHLLKPARETEGVQEDKLVKDGKKGGELTAAPQRTSQPLRTSLCVSLDQILTTPSAPSSATPVLFSNKNRTLRTPSSSAGLTSLQPPRTPRPPLLMPSSTISKSGAAAAVSGGTLINGGSSGSVLHRRAHSAAAPTTRNTRRTSLADAGAALMVQRPASALLIAPSTQHGALPSLHYTSSNGSGTNSAGWVRKARLPQRRTSSFAGDPPQSTTPLSSARGTASLQRSHSAPRVPPVAMLSPRPPSGRAFAVTPRARILSRGNDLTATAAAANDGTTVDGRFSARSSEGDPGKQAARGVLAPPPSTPSTKPEVRQPQPLFIRRLSVATCGGVAVPDVEKSAPPPGRSPTAYDGVVSLEARVHAVPRRVYVNCLYHYLFYLQRTTLAVLESVEELRTHHLCHVAPFIVGHRNYLLEVLTQTSALASDVVVQWLMHEEAGVGGWAIPAAAAKGRGRSAHHPPSKGRRAQSNRSDHAHTPLRPTGSTTASAPALQHTPLVSSLSGSPNPLRRSPSNPTQEAEQAVEAAAHRAVQVAAVQGRWPEQLLRCPLLSTHASLAPFALTPSFLVRVASASAGRRHSRDASSAPTQRRDGAAATEEEKNVRAGVDAADVWAEPLLRLPDAVLERYGHGAHHTENQAAWSGRRSSSATPRCDDDDDAATQGALQSDRVMRPSNAAVVPLKPLSASLQKRLEKAEVTLHREVAAALAYLQLCMQCAVRGEYPLYLRGIAAVHREYVSTMKRCVHDPALKKLSRTSSALQGAVSCERAAETAGQSDRATRRGRSQSLGQSNPINCDTVAFADAGLQASWMEELRVSWQLLMSGSSYVE
ncbi:hypothetical protein ABB37_08244 [Leptomonas pyrrhocoris]|uniref:Uncharacterized protein n=1 Tax=Leptomonas pyrrhocoris TaxID=157538 RepID=A0A0N0DSB5_LEPPY|nr:hypothetical protein ABB37_08244 [Leptomonas pyrrhocoris]XP_015654124.1 hypothetical protein ABB37_08244 [Leptomonas pyrrhocoris]KPA75684.1 hypothetical protein ABB37_08244 [Leptomonas pyrrhocoris]KPA75685.1 hypothetical protein ABB37_08244 [Leptomonas pyrrhocoris]|eukprot:XP_015654123.1 hypothetical protein ABB37_08244 [Leptomonas pyrrhocoris]